MDKLSKKPADNHSTQYNAPSSTNHANVMQKPEHKKSHKKIWIFVGIVAFAIILAAATGAYFVAKKINNKPQQSQSIKIGNIEYTQADINRYKAGIEEYQTQNPNAVKYQDIAKGTNEELVLNAALKKEAQDRNVKVSDEEMKNALGLDYTPDNMSSYLTQAKQFSNLSFVQTIRAENNAYRKKLQDQLIAKRELLVSSVSFDTPFHYRQPNKSDIEKLHQQDIDRLKNELMPLFKQNATKEQIAQKSDVSSFGSNQNSNSDIYFKQIVTNTKYYPNYALQDSTINNVVPSGVITTLSPNDLKTSSFGAIESSTMKDLENVDYGAPVADLRDTNKEIAKLTKKGDFTEIFASKTGAYMIVRLEGISPAPYTSWDDFILKYSNTNNQKNEKTSWWQSIKQNIYNNQHILGSTAMAATNIPETVPYIPAIDADADGSNREKGISSNDCANHPFLMQVDTIEVTGTSGNYQTVGSVGFVVKVNVSQSGGCGSLINGTAWAPFNANGNCMNGQPAVSVVEVAPGWELVGGIAQPWNTQNVNNDGQWGVRYFVKRTTPSGTTVGGSSALVRQDGGAFGNQAQVSGHSLGISAGGYASIYSANQPVISKSWSAQRDVNYTVCAQAPGSVTDGQGRVWSRIDADGQKCQSNIKNGAVASFTFTYKLDGGGSTCKEGDPACDLCLNIDGIQDEVPVGYTRDVNGNCFPPIPQKVFYPWLQTINGDVTSIGGVIRGQVPNTDSECNNDTQGRGGRHANNTEFYKTNCSPPGLPEATYVVASGGDDPIGMFFCSVNQYQLGVNQNEYRKRCNYSKYMSSSVSFDEVNSSIATYYDTNIACQSNLATAEFSLPENINSSGCALGTVFKSQANTTIKSSAAIKGRATIFVNGNVEISQNIVYSGENVVNAKDLPNLAIFATGDIIIDQSVTRLDAVLIAKGRIDTCKQAAQFQSAYCNQKLEANGYWASNLSPSFNRRIYSFTESNINPAEKITMTPQSVLYPPPGLSKSNTTVDTQIQENLRELPPRLK